MLFTTAFIAIALAMTPSQPGLFPTSLTSLTSPFSGSSDGQAVLSEAGEFVYRWPPVSTLYLRAAPLDQIDRWMEREGMRAAVAIKWARHDQLGDCPQRDRWCLCLNGLLGPHSIVDLLTEDQWQAHFDRLAADYAQTRDTRLIGHCLTRFARNTQPLSHTAMPDLTRLMLTLVDAAASGDSTCQVEMSWIHRRAITADRYDRARVIRHIRASINQITTSEQALVLCVLVRTMGLGDIITEPDILGAFVDYGDN